jgi:U3 small nucleolar RNA-associated protein 12
MHGHRSDVRAVCISYDGQLIASCSSEGTKIWSAKTLTCLRSCSTGYGVSIAFVTGNRYLVVGTKEGSLQLVDTASGEVTVDTEEAHDGAIWSIAMQPVEGKGFMTGGADKLVKFWDFSVTNGTLGMSLSKQLQMTHDILCVRYSPLIRGKAEDRVLVAIGLLDHTIKVFYEDSLKFFLSLYGHKLPVMCMDISYDSAILVSGSADKTIKIWGLDFGDCHKSLFAHQESVMALAFVPRTHYFFSAGKDRCAPELPPAPGPVRPLGPTRLVPGRVE